jgi:hypothetical protein
MLRTWPRKAVFTVAAAGTALTLGAGSALAVGGWTIVAAPPTGQNATLTSGPPGSFNPLVLQNG